MLAAADQDDVVEVVLEQVAAGGPGEQRPARGDDRDRAAAVLGVGDADADDQARPWSRAVTVAALTGESPWRGR